MSTTVTAETLVPFETFAPEPASTRNTRARGRVAGRLADSVLTHLRRRDARQTVRCVAERVELGTRVLDLGCGTGHAGALLALERECAVTGCDVVPMNRALTSFRLFDGRRLPFAADAFECTMLAFVLHHAPDPVALLIEAARVTSRRILVLEDTPQGALDRWWGQVHVWGFNGTYGLPKGPRVRPTCEWIELFRAAGLEVAEARPIRRFERLPPIARTAFTLVRSRR